MLRPAEPQRNSAEEAARLTAALLDAFTHSIRSCKSHVLVGFFTIHKRENGIHRSQAIGEHRCPQQLQAGEKFSCRI
jgi:hypothetical protein